jgi:UDP-2,3-diacylglucosamine pyrophosphatase LpxH
MPAAFDPIGAHAWEDNVAPVSAASVPLLQRLRCFDNRRVQRWQQGSSRRAPLFSQVFHKCHETVTGRYELLTTAHSRVSPMNIAVISDLHLGPGDASDSFGHVDSDFLLFLARLEADFERIVLLGDIWETLTSLRPYAPAEGLRCARQAHPELATRFERSQYLYIQGNHDIVAGFVEGAPEKILIDADGVRLLFTHGHHHDWLIRQARWLSEWCVWMGAWIRRVGLSVIYRFGNFIDLALSRPSSSPLKDSFQNWALALAQYHEADIVVTGHTHHAMRSEASARMFLNSGSCTEGRFSYLAIDTKANVYDVCKA